MVTTAGEDGRAPLEGTGDALGGGVLLGVQAIEATTRQSIAARKGRRLMG
jgi:hypothetical protein